MLEKPTRLAVFLALLFAPSLPRATGQSDITGKDSTLSGDQATEAAQWSLSSVQARDYLQKGQLADAEDVLKSTAAHFHTPEFQATALNALGCLYSGRSDYDRSERTFLAAIRTSTAIQDDHSESRKIAANLVDLYLQYGQCGKAERLVRQLESIAPGWASAADASTARIYCQSGTLELIRGRYATAEPLLMHADELLGRLPNTSVAVRVITLNNLAMLNRLTGKFDRALAFARSADQLASSEPSVYPAGHALVLLTLALAEHQTGKPEDAQRHFREGMDMVGRSVALDSPGVADILLAAARYKDVTGQRREAKRLQKRAQLVRNDLSRNTSLGMTVEYSGRR